MAPTPPPGVSPVDYNAEYQDFIAKLTAYHQKRGTNFDPEPRVGAKHVDLLALFKTVVARGGYDKVSDEKLAWRKLGQDFNLGTHNLPALAFSLKSTYYKYLAAYEISTIHGKEPPPREILEDITAKGGNLLTRTLENFRPSRSQANALGGDHSEASGDDGTPARDTSALEDVPGSGGRTRGLRQAPPQRVLFQPEMSSRTPRHVPPPTSSAPPPPRGASTSHNPSSNPENMSAAVANYEPRPPMPLTLRPVITPANNPTEFARRQKAMRERDAMVLQQRPMMTGSAAVSNPRIMLPGTGFDGPNIYVRCLLALKSGIPSEQDYALHHLVKISHERGDKYRFESFPGLAEALVDVMLEASTLFYDVEWRVAYLDAAKPTSFETLNGVDGTPDVVTRLLSSGRKVLDDNVLPAEVHDKLLRITEAALTFRNMAMLEENAAYVADMLPLRDFLCVALNLPHAQSLLEMRHYALDITELLTKYMYLDANDSLYMALLAQLQTLDRGAIITSLRAISRIAMNLEASNRLNGFDTSTLQHILDWTLLEDEELVHACLDFLYQYTAVVDNVNFMLTEVNCAALIQQLSRLLLHGARNTERELTLRPEIRGTPPPADAIQTVPKDLLQVLIRLDEPERSSQWLRCLFEEDKDESITQIQLWQAYQTRFAVAAQETGRPLLPAADFIKNVSTTFADKAAAQVQAGPVQKFIIKGIRARQVPVDLKGREYTRCQWRAFNPAVPGANRPGADADLCGEFFMTPEQMYDHILTTHVFASKNPDGRFLNEEKAIMCRWKGCHRGAEKMKLAAWASHIKIHVIAQVGASSKPTLANGYADGLPSAAASKKRKHDWIEPAVKLRYEYFDTLVDERGDAAGIPLTAVLVLRNLARNIPRTEAEEVLLKEQKEEDATGYVERFFGPMKGRLWGVFAHNKSLVSLFLCRHTIFTDYCRLLIWAI
jgi:chromatin structure-remodeling complex subunit RSC9